MTSWLRALLFLLLAIAASTVFAQPDVAVNPVLLSAPWPAKWITCPEITGQEFGVYLFRKDLTLNIAPEKFVVNISADNRYKLFVNEQYIANGPARGDELNWRFETLDISRHLRAGKNTIAVIVWNFGKDRPLAQHSAGTGLIIQGNSKNESVINTDKSWSVVKDIAYTPISIRLRGAYYVVGPGENFNSLAHPWNWMTESITDEWKSAVETEPGMPKGSHREFGSPAQHVLVPRPIPMMEEKAQRFSKISRSDLKSMPKDFPSQAKAITIPANSKIKILFDQGYLTNAYPQLKFSKGKNSIIRITYAESLFDSNHSKGNRNDVTDKSIEGTYDLITTDGGEHRSFQPLWWRTFRYVEIDVESKEESLIMDDFSSTFTGYPFEEKASFNSSDPILKNIWNVGWRTQRLCAVETYFDCPYYEQLQYAGDSRIQCLVSRYVSGDTMLLRNALTSLHDSRMPFGLTQSRYPSYSTQIIPPFSLVWITMMHDYWMHCRDDKFVRSTLPAVMDVLNWFDARVDSTGMVGHPEWWNFVDWVSDSPWLNGVPPGVQNSNSAVITLQYVYAIQKAADLLKAYGMQESAERYLKLADQLKSSVYKQCFDSQRGLIADTPEKKSFSQHANALAVLTNTFAPEKQTEVMNKIRSEQGIAKCTVYFSFYLIEAMQKAKLSSEFLGELAPWKEMLQLGLTTFAEKPEPTRSDCHAWSASPVYYFLSLVCGIKPNDPGFASVRIEPNPGALNFIDGSMPHRLGMIRVNLKRDKQNKFSGEITLPQNLQGIFIWNGQERILKGGINKI